MWLSPHQGYWGAYALTGGTGGHHGIMATGPQGSWDPRTCHLQICHSSHSGHSLGPFDPSHLLCFIPCLEGGLGSGTGLRGDLSGAGALEQLPMPEAEPALR